MIEATIVRGHGVASGVGQDPRFPDGTLPLQFPIFAAHGLELSAFHRGTINLDITPAVYEIVRPKLTLESILWHPECPPESFSFFDCRISRADLPATDALIYYPHPETKPEHFQSPGVLEILAPRLEGIRYGQTLQLEAECDQIAIHTP